MEIEESIEIIIGPITEIDQEADGTIIGQVMGVTIIRITADKVMSDPNYRQNVQWMSTNRSHSRNRAEN